MLILGSVLTWHWYSPWSRSWLYLIWRVQVSDRGECRQENLLSPVKVITLLVSTCRDDLRIQDTCDSKYL